MIHTAAAHREEEMRRKLAQASWVKSTGGDGEAGGKKPKAD